MPIHDWTRVDAGIFHDFHHTWITEIKRVLNSGLLPPDYYALAEQIAGGADIDAVAAFRFQNNERAFGMQAAVVEGFAQDRGAQAFVDIVTEIFNSDQTPTPVAAAG